MKTSNTKPSKYLRYQTFAAGIVIYDTKAVQSQSLKNLFKNVKRGPV